MALLVEDRQLLARFRDGDPEALERVYRHFAPKVAAFLRSGFVYSSKQVSVPGIVSPFELESAVQEVFVRAFSPQARMAYDGMRPYAGFLYGIARNVVLDERRRRARRGETAEPPEVMEHYYAQQRASSNTSFVELGPADDDAPVEEQLDQRRARELVNQFLDRECDDRDRALYALRYGRELSQEATAREAGLTRIQVRRWESKFRKRLLRFLKRADYVR